MTFLETRLDLGYDFGASYGPRFSTAIAIQSNGQEQRRAMWSQPLIVASLAGRKVDKTELDYLLAFHAAAKGSAYGFRLRDWSDYKSGLVAIGTGNGTAQTWQLVKRYTVAGNTVTRPITKPVADSLTLYLNGVPTVGGWSLNTTNGLLSTTLAGAIAVEFEFDVPVRFEQDQINFTFDAADPFDSSRRLFTLENLTLTEIRIEPQIYPPLDPLPASLPQISLGYDYGTQGGPTFDTGILATSSEFEKRTPYLTDPLGTWNIGDRRLLRSELDYLISFFRVARGMAIPFLFKDWQTETLRTVRFAEDRMSVQFDAHRPHDGESLFNLGGLSLKAIATLINPDLYGYWSFSLRAEEWQIIGGVEVSNGIKLVGDNVLLADYNVNDITPITLNNFFFAEEPTIYFSGIAWIAYANGDMLQKNGVPFFLRKTTNAPNLPKYRNLDLFELKLYEGYDVVAGEKVGINEIATLTRNVDYFWNPATGTVTF